ncbi:hypothetical protein A0M43_00055 [Campylobacter jejuni]|uniref:Ankyrin repeat domain-containing protein n=1 Tax=Campylobacter jejuni TaxID=197 RepID=A0AB36G560_CAMJU|nr:MULTISPECIES: ankyrin repeat domain-containing protein [Campylobacter]EIB18286.1 hypothetical protein cje100_07720 [Campylobacter jejuni subsp. jejuni LMG 23216]EAI4692012.1 ankyrin repeat domain-containing protein [Campylobacter jejuni]EAJ0637095.1 ankyrin repeat domain-containing protein [Campylobacter jejuni]EAK3634545.1 ankyrin repeat domain-containing protein [Campylobacter jejuni]EAL7805636.1 ankyrin repeat domain-containing protein [Campylobacter jejuni]
MGNKDFGYFLNALENNDIKALEILLVDEELSNMQDENGNTLLHHAARLGSAGGVAMLIDCNPFIRNNDGKTAFNIAYDNDDIYIAKMIDNVKDSWQRKHGRYEEKLDESEMDIPFYLTDDKESILKQFKEENIITESLLDTSYGDGMVILQSVLNAWNLSFINKKMPPVVEILIDQANGDVEALIDGFDKHMEQWENEVWDEPAVYAGKTEDGEDDYRYETDPDEWIREIIPFDKWDELKKQMRLYAVKK